MAASKVLVWEDPARIDKAGHLIFPDGQNRGRGTGVLDRGQFDREEEVLWPDGCAAMYRKPMLDEIGGFDEDFFAYGDDAELGLRARIAGWQCMYAPRAVVRHHRGATLGKDSGWRLQLIERNRVLLAVKLFPWSLLGLNPFYYAIAAGGGRDAGARQSRRHGAFSGGRRQADDHARAGARRLRGAAPGSAHAAQARRDPTATSRLTPARSPAPAAGRTACSLTEVA